MVVEREEAQETLSLGNLDQVEASPVDQKQRDFQGSGSFMMAKRGHKGKRKKRQREIRDLSRARKRNEYKKNKPERTYIWLIGR